MTRNEIALDRRRFLASGLTAAGGVLAASCLTPVWGALVADVPGYLRGFEALYAKDPAAAARAWFASARCGLFMHYGLYSLLGRGEWAMWWEKIPLAEYEKLTAQFTAEKFDAAAITDLALAAGMKYVNITTRHHDSFCLFASQHTNYSSVHSAAKRDFVAELAEQCRKKRLGLFLYYSYALDWRHPYFYPVRFLNERKPHFKGPQPHCLWKKEEDSKHYIEFVHGQLRELLTNYGPIAGIWLDPLSGYTARPDLFPIEETYQLIRQLQPQTLISFKIGATGTEDFAAPERGTGFNADGIRRRHGAKSADLISKAWQANRGKHNEICNTLQDGAWGYDKRSDGRHRDSAEVKKMLAEAAAAHCNLLLNTGPLGDGSIHPEDIQTLRRLAEPI
ncbi:MAG: alpha-L-fucosidase [Planctomycetes bacterium]|nr:alpha-L-fucosidase [Planctomycetota bacterium]